MAWAGRLLGGPQSSERSEEEGETQPLLPKVRPRPRSQASGEGPAPQRGGQDMQPSYSRPGSARDRTADLEAPGTFRDSLGPVQNPDQQQLHRRDSTLQDPRRLLLDGLLERSDFQDERINREALARGRQKLLDALAGREIQGVDEDLPNIMIYKGRPLFSAHLLHLAVWCSAQLREASLVELVLHHLEGTSFIKAKYLLPSRRPGWRVELQLDAIHIACGLGALPALAALVQHFSGQADSPGGSPRSKPSRTMQDYVNMYTIKFSQEIDNPQNTTTDNFYTPIHEATDKGFTDVAEFLLLHGADGGQPNLDGMFPLHFVAMRGSAGGICTGDYDSLRRVVQELQEAGGSLEERVSRQHFNPKLAGRTPLQLAAAGDSRFPRQMMGLLVPCLQDKSFSVPRFFADIAFLTALDAEAAAYVVREVQVRAARNNSVLQRFRLDAQLGKRTDLMASIIFLAPEAGVLMLEMLVGDPIVQDASKHNIPTRTTLYGFWQHLPMRCVYRPDMVRRENVTTPIWSFETDKPLEKQPEIAWHRWLVPETDGFALRTDYVYNVSVSTVLMPNILDLDMFVALGRSLQHRVFDKLSVKGMIYCLWNNLVDNLWLAELCFHLVELVVLMWWGLAWPVNGPRQGIQADKPFCWAVITAGAIRELCQLTLGMHGCFRKFQAHEEPTMRSLWHPLSALFMEWAIPKLVLMLLQMRFAWGSAEDLGESELSELDQVLLATTVLLKATQVTYSFRLCAGGSKIYAIFFSFLGGATREMISIVFMIFLSFSLAFSVLAKDKAFGWVLASSYRGLLFGDGDGFNNLGLDVHEDSYRNNDSMLMVFLVVGSFFFNIILLNLIIAVYGNEYDKVAHETPLLFLHGRAKYCVTYVMSCQLVPWVGVGVNLTLYLLSAVLFTAAIVLHLNRKSLQSWELGVACLLGASQVVLQAALAQCEWFSVEGVAADGKDRFLWICHRAKEAESGSKLVHSSEFEEKLAGLRKHVDTRMGTLEAKLDAILERLSER